MHRIDPALAAAVDRLLDGVAHRAIAEGRTDSPYPGLRYYRFSSPVVHEKTQRLMPGIVVVLQGRKTVRLFSDDALTYAAGDCLVLGAEVLCRGTVVEAGAGRPYLAIHLDLPPALLVKAFVALADAGVGLPAAHPVKTACVVSAELGLLGAFARLLLATDTLPDRHTLAPLAVEEIAVRLLRSPLAWTLRDAAAMTRSAARIQRTMQYMQAALRRPVTLAELAEHASMSPSHFAHTFRQVAGVSPMRHLRNLRLDEARAQLVAGARPGEVGFLAGFESAAHFHREFKRRFDATPSEYVRRLVAPVDRSGGQ